MPKGIPNDPTKPRQLNRKARPPKQATPPLFYDDGLPVYSPDDEEAIGEADRLSAEARRMPPDTPDPRLHTVKALEVMPDESASTITLRDRVFTRDDLLQAIRVMKPKGKLKIV